MPTRYMWGDSVTVTRLSLGRYQLNFATQNMNSGNVQVTALTAGTEHCKVESWGAFKATVRCYMPDGTTLKDTQFTLRYTLGNQTANCGSPGIYGPGIHDTTYGSGGYVLWNGTIPAANMYSIFEADVSCSTGCGITSTPVTVSTLAPGQYFIRYPDFTLSNSVLTWQLPLVTAQGPTSVYCKLSAYWKLTLLGTELKVDCWSGNGASKTNANFSNLLFTQTFGSC